jgi:hypothetical protein
VLDEIETLLVLHYPSQSVTDKQSKMALLRRHFNAVWTKIPELMSLLDLRVSYDSLHHELEGKTSRYGGAAVPDMPAFLRREKNAALQRR